MVYVRESNVALVVSPASYMMLCGSRRSFLRPTSLIRVLNTPVMGYQLIMYLVWVYFLICYEIVA